MPVDNKQLIRRSFPGSLFSAMGNSLFLLSAVGFPGSLFKAMLEQFIIKLWLAFRVLYLTQCEIIR